MSVVEKSVYVISDLHLGGAAAGERWPGSPSFRMMTRPDLLARFIRELAEKPSSGPAIELVINGDFVDFLAEEHTPDSEGNHEWVPFIDDPDVAAAVFSKVVKRNSEVFDALAMLLARGHALTVISGNHDLELTLPSVRAVFSRVLGLREGPRKEFRFLMDGEAYEVGDALIEHGNRYDPSNVVDHDRLRQVRSLLSRRRNADAAGRFPPPIGSRVVAELMNPIKEEYPFIDLLKPESEPLFALLLALEPGYKWRLARLARIMKSIPKHLMKEETLTFHSGDISSTEEGSAGNYLGDISSRGSDENDDAADEDALREVVAGVVGQRAAEQLVGRAQAEMLGDISSMSERVRDKVNAFLGVGGLVLMSGLMDAESRLPLVQNALRAVSEDRSFDEKYETGKRYKKAAEALSKGQGTGDGYRFVVFGHTHHAKDLVLDSGARYLNSGTWANLMRFPGALLSKDPKVAAEALAAFHEDMKESRLEKYVELHPSFVRLEVAGASVVDAGVGEASLL